ncbi:sorting nexin-6-like [Sycon ciliatum]|uniref:sorting nexin-6-like n=1 Tax=Sycon ciliatum TaxID=27933 RepID=UPI0020AE4525|eukprot:scpid53241/ scgid26376/ Sorting nexin-6; TRAF4-associated factor 2
MMEDDPALGEPSPSSNPATSNIDLSTDTSLVVDISDALSEHEKVKFTVHTKTTLPEFRQSEFSVVREHEEFVWLHDRYVENEEYAGIVIPPAPPRPDFDESRDKLYRLGQSEGQMTKAEFQKMKAELEAEYLAEFKKTVAMHEVFLSRIAGHARLRNEHNFRVFLEYKDELQVRGKNKKERLGGLFKNLGKTVDEAMLANYKDVDESFEKEKTFLSAYHVKVKDATRFADRMTRSHKGVADCHIPIAICLHQLGTSDPTELSKFLTKIGETFERARKLEGRVSSDCDLKLSDTLRYYERDSQAALDLLYRRTRSLANLEKSNNALTKARTKGKGVAEAEAAQKLCEEKFNHLSEIGKQELGNFKARRLTQFRKNMTELAELQIKHAKAQLKLLREVSEALQ